MKSWLPHIARATILVLSLSVTFDHRFIDGFHAAAMSRILKQWMEHPFEHFDPATP